MKKKRNVSMLELIFKRETGLDDPRKLAELKKTQRIHSLRLSSEKTFESFHTGGINSLSLSPDLFARRFMLSAASRGTIAIHDLSATHGRMCNVVAKVGQDSQFMHKLNVETVSWYPHDSGMFLSSSADASIKVWDTNLMQPVEDFCLQDIVYRHQMSPVATVHSLVAAACRDSRVYLADLQSGSATHILKGHKKAVLSLAWSTRDPSMLASGSSDNRVLLWDIRRASGPMHVFDQHNGKQTSEFTKYKTAHNGHINAMAFTSSGLNLVTYGTDDRVRLWDISTGRNCLVNYGRIPNQCKKGVQIAISNTSKELAFLPSLSDILAVDLHSGKHITKLRGAFNSVNCCAYEENYQELYSGSNDTFILSWQPEQVRVVGLERSNEDKSLRDLRTQPGPNVYQDTWSSDED